MGTLRRRPADCSRTAVIAKFVKKWRHRLDFLRRETATQASGLANLVAAIAQRPASDAPVVVLVATPATARFLIRFGGVAGLGEVEVHAVADLSSLELQLAALDRGASVVVSGELYARFHATLAPYVAAGQILPA